MIIVVLGGGIELNGTLPHHAIKRLDAAIELFNKNPESYIALSGKYSYIYWHKKTHPIQTEASAMAAYLCTHGIDPARIYMEEHSMDTISNAYFLKKTIFIPKDEHTGIIITSEFHLKRVKMIFSRIFGDTFQFKYISVPDIFPPDKAAKIHERQQYLIEQTEIFLKDMSDGDHEYLKDKLYTAKFHHEEKPAWLQDFVAAGKSTTSITK
ncbi:hypothetical protein BH09PAT2_BH09PAT2_07570 [soil metagenome]